MDMTTNATAKEEFLARKLCEIRGIDPDSCIQGNSILGDPFGNGVNPRYKEIPNWKFVIEEVGNALAIEELMRRFVRVNPQ